MTLNTTSILLKLKNALLKQKIWVEVSAGLQNERLLVALGKSGFIRGFEKSSGKKKGVLKIFLKYDVCYIPTITQYKIISTIEKKRSMKSSSINAASSKSLKTGFCYYYFSRFSKNHVRPVHGDFLFIIA